MLHSWHPNGNQSIVQPWMSARELPLTWRGEFGETKLRFVDPKASFLLPTTVPTLLAQGRGAMHGIVIPARGRQWPLLRPLLQ